VTHQLLNLLARHLLSELSYHRDALLCNQLFQISFQENSVCVTDSIACVCLQPNLASPRVSWCGRWRLRRRTVVENLLQTSDRLEGRVWLVVVLSKGLFRGVVEWRGAEVVGRTVRYP